MHPGYATRTENSSTRDSGHRPTAARRLATWGLRVGVIALSVAVALGINAVAHTVYTSGLNPTLVRITNESTLVDTADLRARLEATHWGRQTQLFVAIASESRPAPQPRDAVADAARGSGHEAVSCGTRSSYARSAFPETATWPYLAPSAVYVCLDPYSGEVDVASSLASLASDQAREDFTRLLIDGRVDDAAIASILQRMARDENDSRTIVVSNVPRAASIILGILLGLIALAAIDSFWQTGVQIGYLSRRSRRARAHRIDERFTRISVGIDELQLACLGGPTSLEARFEEWMNRYTQLCADLADARRNASLSAWASRRSLVHLDHLSAIVEQGYDALLHDAKSFASGSYPALVNALTAARDEAWRLAEGITAHRDALESQILTWTHRLEAADGALDPAQARRIHTSLAQDIDSATVPFLARYTYEHSTPYPHAEVFSVPAQILGIELSAPPLPDLTDDEEPISRGEIAARARRSAPPVRTPFTPATVASAAIVGLVAGTLAPLVVAAWDDARASETPPPPYAAAPRDLPGAGYLDEVASSAPLRRPASVDIVDRLGVLGNTNTLASELSRLGFATARAPHLHVVTTPLDACWSSGKRLSSQQLDLSTCLPDLLAPAPSRTNATFGDLDQRVAVVAKDPTALIVVFWTSQFTPGISGGVVIAGDSQLNAQLTRRASASSPWHPDRFIDQADALHAVWNGLVATAHFSRGLTTPTATAIVHTRPHPLTLGLGVGLAAAVLWLVAGLVLTRWREKRRRDNDRQRTITTLLTQATLDVDRLQLEAVDLSNRVQGYTQAFDARMDAWSDTLNEANEAAGTGSCEPAPLLHQERLAHLVALQRASLWRVRSILTCAPGWRRAWEREVLALASLAPAMDESDVLALINLEDEVYADPVTALGKLDALAQRWPITAAARALAPASSLDANDPGWEHLTRVPTPSRYTAPGFFRVTSPGRALTRVLLLLTCAGLVVWAVSAAQAQYRPYWEADKAPAPQSVAPASVRVDVADAGLDAKALTRAASTARLAAPLHIVIASPASLEDYRVPVFLGKNYPGLLMPGAYAEAQPLPRTVVFNVGHDSLAVTVGNGCVLTDDAERILANYHGGDPTRTILALLKTPLVRY